MREVRLVMLNPKYRNKTFYAIVPWNPKKGKYMTGQEDMTDAELKKEPFIIVPDDQIPLANNMKFLVATETELKNRVPKTKDDVIYRAILNMVEIANTRDEFDSSQHVGYLEDKEREAEHTVTKSMRVAEAYTKVFNDLDDEKVRQLCIFLEIRYKQTPLSVRKQLVLERCQNSPDDVLRYFEKTESVNDEVFVKNLVDKNIFTKKRNGYFVTNSNDFVGETLEDVRKYMSKDENAGIVKIWQERLVEE